MTVQLANVKQTLDLLVDKGSLTPARQQWVLDGIKMGGLKGFAGQIVVEKGWASRENLDNALKEQAGLKANAAVSDIELIAKNGAQEIPAWLKVNLGNNGVNAAAWQPSLVDGASAAANIAQNTVILANRAPELAPQLKPAIESASALALYLAGKTTEQVPLTILQRWQQDATDGLRKAAAHFQTNEQLRNAVLHPTAEGAQQVPSPEQVESFIAERSKEIAAAVELTSPWQTKLNSPSLPSSGLPPR